LQLVQAPLVLELQIVALKNELTRQQTSAQQEAELAANNQKHLQATINEVQEQRKKETVAAEEALKAALATLKTELQKVGRDGPNRS